MTPPPTPFHILRAHQAPLSCLAFTEGNTHLLSGDQDGVVAITDLGTRRVVVSWKAHEGGVLGVGEWDGALVSQGRDNKVKFYERPRGSSEPKVARELDSNSLNFCKFALAPIPSDDKEKQGILALPNLADSELVDIYLVPSLVRIHAAVNYTPRKKGGPRSGLVMAVHAAVRGNTVALVAGYEDGRVEVWSCPLAAIRTEWDARKSDANMWTRLWEGKCHNEAVMAMGVDRGFTRAFTVSADHLVVRVDLESILSNKADDRTLASYSTKQIGNGSVAVSSDGRVVAVGGWDGRIRLFSAATFKPLGTLSYHRDSVHCLAFANPASPTRLLRDTDNDVIELGDSDDSDDEQEDRTRWLVSGGKDTRVAMWSLIDFSR